MAEIDMEGVPDVGTGQINIDPSQINSNPIAPVVVKPVAQTEEDDLMADMAML